MDARLPTILLIVIGLLACGDAGDSATEQADADGTGDDEPSTIPVNAPRNFPTATVSVGDAPQPLVVTGRVVPLQSATLSAQVPGVVLPSTKLLQEGKFYRKGETVVAIDDETLRRELTAARAELTGAVVRLLPRLRTDFPAAYPLYKSFADSLDPTLALPSLPTAPTDTVRYFLAAAGIDAQYYGIAARESTLGDFVVAAPFSGKLTSASVEPGAVVQPGQPLATLQRTDVYEVRLSVPVAAADDFSPGQSVELRSRQLDRDYTGTINRFGPVIDAGTQTLTAFARVSGTGLYPGLYLEADLARAPLADVAQVPAGALTRDNHVHVIRDGVVALSPVELVQQDGATAYVRGLRDGELIVTETPRRSIVGTRVQ